MNPTVSIEAGVSTLEEELAGPVAAPAMPINLRNRISSIDVLRGFALLGILVMNIEDFGGVEAFHDVPVGGPIQNFVGPHAHLNLVLLLFKWMFVEGKMRGIFSMLFGAGAILLIGRREHMHSQDAADIFARRNLLLMLFGILHCCFIWHGDILFDYGFQALLFLYPMRRLKARTLLWTGTILSLLLGTAGLVAYSGAPDDYQLSTGASKINAQLRLGKPITPRDSAVLAQWKARVDSQTPNAASIQKAVTEGNLPYWSGVLQRVEVSFQTGFYVLHIDLLVDSLSIMMVGMGLMKIGFLSAELPISTYVWTALIGFSISLPLTFVGVLKAYASGFYFLEIEKWLYLPYYLEREAGALAISATVLILVKTGIFSMLQKWFAAVGRTAFSNYIFTSVICQTIFLWGPWRLYAKLAYYQEMYVVFGIWAFNLIASSLWLQRFSFGPLEWLWRSLTYGALQPMRLKKFDT